ncbi:hypothetical protein B7494_g6856 [Chlorociboria aeruginascens]|nr:hypothetical protein B7494_g6856 [Chlorociboria aeruginascens]
MAPKSRTYPLHNTSFTLHRVSPFYTGLSSALSNTDLRAHARRLQDILAGETLRGVRVGLGEGESLARAGALRSVSWKILPGEEDWGREAAADESSEGDTSLSLNLGGESESGSGRGLLLRVDYENISYSAIFLRGQARPGREGFEHFPLGLVRMPLALRETALAFLAATFDTRVSALRLPKGYIVGALEKYILDCVVDDDGDEREASEQGVAIRKFVKEIHVTIGFDSTGGALKTMDVQVAAEDVPRMVAWGRREGGGFWRALEVYVNGHLALDVNHRDVKVVKIACGGFTLGDGRVKLLVAWGGGGGDRARGDFVEGLVEMARGGDLRKDG